MSLRRKLAVCFAAAAIAVMIFAVNRVPHPTLHRYGGEGNGAKYLPSELILPSEKEGGLYRISVEAEAVRKEIEKAFPIRCDKETSVSGYAEYTAYENDLWRVSMSASTGHWRCDYKISPRAVAEEKFLSDEEAVKAAGMFLKEHELDVAEEYETAVSSSQTSLGADGGMLTEAKTVFFYPLIDGKQVIYGYFISVTVDSCGEVIAVNKMAHRPEINGQSVRLKNRSQVMRALEKGEYTSVFPAESNQVRMHSAELAYYADNRLVGKYMYLYPVYVLRGELNDGSTEVSGYVIIDALAP